jgi:hypothetical protein
MQFVGLLLIVNSLLGGAWWVATGRPQQVVLPVCVAAMAAGVFLIVHDRSATAAAARASASPTQPSAAPASVPEMDDLAKQVADAKALLSELQDVNAAADWYVKKLDQNIHDVHELPDGRTRVGNTVTGQAVVLIPKLEALQKLDAAQKTPGDRSIDMFPLAKECILIYETTKEQTRGVVLTGGEIGLDTIGWMYTTGASAAQYQDDQNHALQWARSAVAIKSTPERQMLLVTSLINKNLQGEASVLIQQQIKAGGPDAAKFKQYLEQLKIPYKKED